MGIFQEKKDVYLCPYKEMTNCFKLFSGKPHMETYQMVLFPILIFYKVNSFYDHTVYNCVNAIVLM